MNLFTDSDVLFIKTWQQVEYERMQTVQEAYNLFTILNSLKPLCAPIAEFGVWLGGSAKLLSTIKEDTIPFYLFDTFSGMPKSTAVCDARFCGIGARHISIEKVTGRLQMHPNICFCVGVFSKIILDPRIKDLEFCFVHLDVDMYTSTCEGLEFFYPRLLQNGVLISHDYNNDKCSVKQAIDEFFRDKPEKIEILENTTQCLIRKL